MPGRYINKFHSYCVDTWAGYDFINSLDDGKGPYVPREKRQEIFDEAYREFSGIIYQLDEEAIQRFCRYIVPTDENAIKRCSAELQAKILVCQIYLRVSHKEGI